MHDMRVSFMMTYVWMCKVASTLEAACTLPCLEGFLESAEV